MFNETDCVHSTLGKVLPKFVKRNRHLILIIMVKQWPGSALVVFSC